MILICEFMRREPIHCIGLKKAERKSKRKGQKRQYCVYGYVWICWNIIDANFLLSRIGNIEKTDDRQRQRRDLSLDSFFFSLYLSMFASNEKYSNGNEFKLLCITKISWLLFLLLLLLFFIAHFALYFACYVGKLFESIGFCKNHQIEAIDHIKRVENVWCHSHCLSSSFRLSLFCWLSLQPSPKVETKMNA